MWRELSTAFIEQRIAIWLVGLRADVRNRPMSGLRGVVLPNQTGVRCARHRPARIGANAQSRVGWLRKRADFLTPCNLGIGSEFTGKSNQLLRVFCPEITLPKSRCRLRDGSHSFPHASITLCICRHCCCSVCGGWFCQSADTHTLLFAEPNVKNQLIHQFVKHNSRELTKRVLVKGYNIGSVTDLCPSRS